MSTFTFRVEDDVIFCSGSIDQTFDPDSLTAAGDSVKFNFRKVVSMNSIGVRQFLRLVDRLRGRQVDFQECPPELLAAFSIIPPLLGDEGSPARISSFLMPHTCDKCGDEINVSIKSAELKVKGQAVAIQSSEVELEDGEVRFPPRACPRCGNFMSPDEVVAQNVADLIVIGAVTPGLRQTP